MNFYRLRVLIVDDDPDAAELVALTISALGCECRTANTAADALTTAQDQQPHIVVLDLALNGSSGSSVATTLRRERGDGVYLVAFTGSTRQTHIVLADGFDAHVVKPGSPTVLRDVVTRAAQRFLVA